MHTFDVSNIALFIGMWKSDHSANPKFWGYSACLGMPVCHCQLAAWQASAGRPTNLVICKSFFRLHTFFRDATVHRLNVFLQTKRMTKEPRKCQDQRDAHFPRLYIFCHGSWPLDISPNCHFPYNTRQRLIWTTASPSFWVEYRLYHTNAWAFFERVRQYARTHTRLAVVPPVRHFCTAREKTRHLV